MNQFEFTPVMLAGLVTCSVASLLLAALLVIAIVPAVQATVLQGLEVIVGLLSKLIDVGLPLVNRVRPNAVNPLSYDPEKHTDDFPPY